MVESIEFKDALTTWREQLWPERKSEIESHSAMKWLGGIDMRLMASEASFWRFRSGDLHAILSGHFGGFIDTAKSYRTRGLWVPPELRRQGVARKLMTAAFNQARAEGCSLVWTFPRESAMPFYKSMGFAQVGESGPNVYAIAKL